LSSLRRYLPFATFLLATAALYLYQLDGVGMLGPDEPRYTAIGRAMAQSGDFVTPRLWGAPWFEKPPLLYWMAALGTSLGLNADLIARLPVVLLSLAFLGLFCWLIKLEFGGEVAFVSTVLLATSAGWLTYSSLGLTDLPLAVFFSLAVLLALPLVGSEGSGHSLRWALIGFCLGLAALAKGLVPWALAAPGFWFLRSYWRRWWIAAVCCFAIAGPWYWLVTERNGSPFVEEFFFKHHIERLYSASLQHLQPWYYYVPVLLAAVFPWTPLLALLFRKQATWEKRRIFLLATVLFGMSLFSISRNKLAGYLLPLVPPLAVLVASQFETKPLAEWSRKWLLMPAILIALIPLIAGALPATLAAGRVSALRLPPFTPTEAFYIAAPLAVLVLARRNWMGLLLALCVVGSAIYLKTSAYPVIDQTVSARSLWREIKSRKLTFCDGGVNRDWIYGLSYYQGSAVPACGSGHFDVDLVAKGRARPALSAPTPGTPPSRR
jgi:4-amino-4-deoxy-L-arabinose transferase-like glycosyltransferase